MGVTGSIAAYKACDIVSGLRKKGVDVHVILTKAGAEIITPLTLETLSNNPVVVDMFNRENPWEVEHISLAKLADRSRNGELYRQNGFGHSGRYADHHRDGHQSSCYHSSRYEFQYVPQHRHTEKHDYPKRARL